MTLITFLLLGLGNGAVFAALGLSIALTYRTSNVVNFGAGSMALFGAVNYETLRSQHALFNPFAAAYPLAIGGLCLAVLFVGSRWRRNGIPSPGKVGSTLAAVGSVGALAFQPTLLDIGVNLPTAAALVVTCAISASLGLALYGLVFRRLRDAVPLTRVVAAIGVLLLVPGLVGGRLGNNPIEVPPIFPATVWHLGRVVIQQSQVGVALVTVVVAIALGLVYRRTRFGLKATTAAETDTGAVVLGISPNRLGACNWAVGAAVAGAFGALIVSFAAVSPYDFALFVVAGLAAAMIGGMSSLGWAAAAGLGIGMLQSEMQYLGTRYSFLPQQGLTSAVPFVLLAGVMIFRSKALPERGSLLRRALPSARPPRHVREWTVGLSAVGVALALTLHGDYQVALATSLIGLLFALSLVVLTGFVGQISLAQYMFAGISAFLLSRLTVDWGIPFPIAPLLSASTACLVGVVLAMPASRVRGVNLAIMSLAAALAVEQVYFNSANYVGGGGSPTVVAPALFGLQLSIGANGQYPRPAFALMALVIAVVVALLVVGIRRSALGLQMLAVRANERAAAANGIDVARVKIVGFGVSAFIAGLAGSLLAYFNYGGFSSVSFDIFVSITLVASTFIAGITMVSGAVIAAVGCAGGVGAVLLQHAVPSLPAWYAVFAGLSMIATAVGAPEGIAWHLAGIGPVRLRRRRTGRIRLEGAEWRPSRGVGKAPLSTSVPPESDEKPVVRAPGDDAVATIGEVPR